MDYVMLKVIHIGAVVVSFFGFAARELGVLQGASWVCHRLTRTLPHLVDTVLLFSALGMFWVMRLSPWALPWLRAKIIGLVIYIALGVLALRLMSAARAPWQRRVGLIACIGALAVFGYIVSVALTKSPAAPSFGYRTRLRGSLMTAKRIRAATQSQCACAPAARDGNQLACDVAFQE